MITADGDDKIHCNCPYCGESLLVNLQRWQVLLPLLYNNLLWVRVNRKGLALH